MGSIRQGAVVYTPTGTNRLRMLQEWEGGGGDFHSIVWEQLEGDEWKPRYTITRDEFQWGHPFRRWVAAIDSLHPDSAEAVIQVAEGDKPEPTNPMEFRGTKFLYSWRLWNLRTNSEVKVVSQCESPFDRPTPRDES